MAHKMGASSTRNGRDSNAQRLGVKRFGGQVDVELSERLLQEGHVQVLLRPEIEVDGADGEASLLRDVLDRGLGVAPLCEDLASRRLDAATTCLTLLLLAILRVRHDAMCKPG